MVTAGFSLLPADIVSLSPDILATKWLLPGATSEANGQTRWHEDSAVPLALLSRIWDHGLWPSTSRPPPQHPIWRF